MLSREFIIIGHYDDVRLYAPEYKQNQQLIFDPNQTFTSNQNRVFIANAIRARKFVVCVTPIAHIIGQASYGLKKWQNKEYYSQGMGSGINEILWLNDNDYEFACLRKKEDLLAVKKLLKPKHVKLMEEGHLFIAHPAKKSSSLVVVDPFFDKYINVCIGSEDVDIPNFYSGTLKIRVLQEIAKIINDGGKRDHLKLLTKTLNDKSIEHLEAKAIKNLALKAVPQKIVEVLPRQEKNYCTRFTHYLAKNFNSVNNNCYAFWKQQPTGKRQTFSSDLGQGPCKKIRLC